MSEKTVAAVLVSVTLVGVAACGGDRQSPVVPPPVTRSLAPVGTSLTIRGKAASPGVTERRQAWLGRVPGETARLTATGKSSDNTERDVTAETAWTCPDATGAVGVALPGVVHSQVPGWVILVARHGSAQSSNGRSEHE